MTSEIEQLLTKLRTIPDYPALQEVQRALWGTGETRGAAVMVGAGFSVNAERTSTTAPAPPLWLDFSRRMTADLYPSSPELAGSDPLRLAEEYRAAFGAPALEAMIREMVPDRLWKPGSLHRELLALPWADVLTTNWDTLLERAALEEHDRAYELVETVDAIARTRSPRIVKLHGSLPSQRPFIFAAEDYRTYPSRFAPFVNLAQQAILENEMVLLGFSGNDPNFLQWTGWVRDQLGASARRIRLVGVLRLSAARRRLLESLNVTPIDLEPLVSDLDAADQHRAATETLLASLRAARPQSVRHWSQEFDRLDDNVEPSKIIEAWSAVRASYPGWLLAPRQARQRLRYGMDSILFSVEKMLSELDDPVRGALIREILWRCNTALLELPHWVVAALPNLVAKKECGFDRGQCLEAYLALATSARWRRDKPSFDEAVASAVAYARSSDDRAAIAYEQCLEARDRLDYQVISDHIREVDGSDPAWALRRSALQAFMRDRAAAVRTTHAALKEIRRRRARDRGSVWLLSREAWAHLVVRQGWYDLPELDGDRDDWPTKYGEIDCDPWDEFTNFDHLIQEEGRGRYGEQLEDERSFEPGIRIQEPGDDGWTSSARVRPFDELSRMVDQVGFARLPSVDVVEQRLQTAALSLGDGRCDSWSILLTVRDPSKGLINRRFNRVAVARMDQAVVNEQINALRSAVEFGRHRLARLSYSDAEERQSYWVEQVRRMLELLSRLAIRMQNGDAGELFRWACNLTKDLTFDHWWLYKPLDHLLTRCLEAVSPNERCTLALQILEVPLPGERELPGMDRDWPELDSTLAEFAPRAIRGDEAWTVRIAKTLSLLGSEKHLARSRALLRIYALNKQGILTPNEVTGAVDGIWSSIEDGCHLPSHPDLMPSIFFELPEPHSGATADAFRSEIVARILSGGASYADFEALGNAAQSSRPFKLTADEATAVAARILEWSPPQRASRQGFRIPEWSDRQEADSRAHAFSKAVIPALPDSGLNAKLADAVFTLAAGAPGFIGALPDLVVRMPDIAERAYREIRRSFVSSNIIRAYAGSRGLYAWIKLAKSGELALPERLSSDVIAAVEARREPALLPALQSAHELISSDFIAPERLEHLPDTLDLLFVETAYSNQDRGGLRSDTLTMIRAACIRLASVLQRKGMLKDGVADWTVAASTDPIPEVRLALSLNPDD